MHLIDYTHPEKVPPLRLAHDRRSAEYYLRLDQLPLTHPYGMKDWALFRHSDWLEGGSAWVQALFIVKDLEQYMLDNNLSGLIRPVVGSADHAFDEGLAQGIISLGFQPLVAEVTPRELE